MTGNGDIRINTREEQVQIILAVDITQILKDTELVTLGSLVTLGHVVHGLDTWRRDGHITETEEVTQELHQRQAQGAQNRRQETLRSDSRAFLDAGFIGHVGGPLHLHQVDTRLDEVNVALHMLGDVVPVRMSY